MYYSDDGINWSQSTLQPFDSELSSFVYGAEMIKQYIPIPLSIKLSRTGNISNAVTVDVIYNSLDEVRNVYSCVYKKELGETDDILTDFSIGN